MPFRARTSTIPPFSPSNTPSENGNQQQQQTPSVSPNIVLQQPKSKKPIDIKILVSLEDSDPTIVYVELESTVEALRHRCDVSADEYPNVNCGDRRIISEQQTFKELAIAENDRIVFTSLSNVKSDNNNSKLRTTMTRSSRSLAKEKPSAHSVAPNDNHTSLPHFNSTILEDMSQDTGIHMPNELTSSETGSNLSEDAPCDSTGLREESDPGMSRSTTNEAGATSSEYGDLVAAIENNQSEKIRELLQRDDAKELLLMKDGNGRLPIHHACAQNLHHDSFQLILDAAVEHKIIKQMLEEKNNVGLTCPHIACACELSTDSFRLLLKYLSKHADMKKVLHEKINGGATCLQFACRFKISIDSLRLLLEYLSQCADIKKVLEEKDNRGRTCLHHACSGNLPTASLKHLLKSLSKHADIKKILEEKNKEGATCLRVACANNLSTDSLQILLKYLFQYTNYFATLEAFLAAYSPPNAKVSKMTANQLADWRKEVWQETSNLVELNRYSGLFTGGMPFKSNVLHTYQYSETATNVEAGQVPTVSCFAGDCLDAVLKLHVKDEAARGKYECLPKKRVFVMVSSDLSTSPSQQCRDGSRKQQAEICRRSTLAFQADHRLGRQPSTAADPTELAIDKGYYVRDVIVFRGGAKSEYVLLPKTFPITCGVVVPPSNPNLADEDTMMPEDAITMRNSLRLFFRMAIAAGARYVVPIALGCGSRGCPSKHVMKLMMQVIHEECTGTCVQEILIAVNDANIFHVAARSVMLEYGTISTSFCDKVSVIEKDGPMAKIQHNSLKIQQLKLLVSQQLESFALDPVDMVGMTANEPVFKSFVDHLYKSLGDRDELSLYREISAKMLEYEIDRRFSPDHEIQRLGTSYVFMLNDLRQKLENSVPQVHCALRDAFGHPFGHRLSFCWILNLIISFLLLISVTTVHSHFLNLDFMIAPYVDTAEGCFFESITQSTQQNNSPEGWPYADQPLKTCLRNNETFEQYRERWLKFVLSRAEANSDCNGTLFAIGGNRVEEKINENRYFIISNYSDQEVSYKFSSLCNSSEICQRFFLLFKTTMSKHWGQESGLNNVVAHYDVFVEADWKFRDAGCRSTLRTQLIFTDFDYSDWSGVVVLFVILPILGVIGVVSGWLIFRAPIDVVYLKHGKPAVESFQDRGNFSIYWLAWLFIIAITVVFIVLVSIVVAPIQAGLWMMCLAAGANFVFFILHCVRWIRVTWTDASTLDDDTFTQARNVLESEDLMPEQQWFGKYIPKQIYLNHWGAGKLLAYGLCSVSFLVFGGVLLDIVYSEGSDKDKLQNFLLFSSLRSYFGLVQFLYAPIGLELILFFPQLACSAYKLPSTVYVVLIYGIFVTLSTDGIFIPTSIGEIVSSISSFINQITFFSGPTVDATLRLRDLVIGLFAIILFFTAVDDVEEERRRKPRRFLQVLLTGEERLMRTWFRL